MAADDKLIDHTGYAEEEHTCKIEKNEHGTTILPGHIGETPHVAQSDGRTCRSKDNTQFAAKVCSLYFCHFNISFDATFVS